MKKNPVSKKEVLSLSTIDIPAYPVLKGENHPFYGRKHSDKAKKLMSLKKKGIKRVPLSEEHKEKLRKKRPHAGKNIANGKSFNWIITKVDTGYEFKIKNLNEFCRKNNLAPGNMYKTLKGKTRQHKGFSLKHDRI